MLRNPFSRIRQETERIAQIAVQTPEMQARTGASAAGATSIGIIDSANGALRPYGQLDFTPLDEGDGFVLV